MKKKQTTKKQHFIPQMVLRNFCITSQDGSKKLLQIDTLAKSRRLVIPKEICQRKNLYEYKNENNENVKEVINFIENCLSHYEREWNNIFNKIKKFEPLTPENCGLLYLFMIIQWLRVPKNIDNIQNGLKLSYPDLKDFQAINLVRSLIFPSNCSGFKNNDIFQYYIKAVCCFKNIHIYHSKEPLIINDSYLSMPLICSIDSRQNYLVHGWFATISPNTCIVISNRSDPELYKELPNNFSNYINDYYKRTCERFIYSQPYINCFKD